MWPSEKSRPAMGAHEAVSRRHLSTVPTRLGTGLLVMVVLLWLVGLNYQANLAYIAAFWLAGFIIAAVRHNRSQLAGLRFVIETPSEIFAGEPVEISVGISGGPRRHFWLRAEDGEWFPCRIEDGKGSAAIMLGAQMRGCLHLPVFEIATAAPFGICITECRIRPEDERIVFPAPQMHEPPAAFHADENTGVQAAAARSSDELSHLQAHQSGASLQHIAWKTYAKTGEMLDKKFSAEEVGAGGRIISYRDYPAAGTELLAGLLCHRVLEAEKNGIPYILELPERTIAPQNGLREICLTALALM